MIINHAFEEQEDGVGVCDGSRVGQGGGGEVDRGQVSLVGGSGGSITGRTASSSRRHTAANTGVRVNGSGGNLDKGRPNSVLFTYSHSCASKYTFAG